MPPFDVERNFSVVPGLSRTKAAAGPGIRLFHGFGQIPDRGYAASGMTTSLLSCSLALPAPEMPSALLCLATCPDAETAARIARVLVEERLAACVNRVPGITSTYRWQGQIHEDAEVLLLIKTTHARFEALRARLVELHPYELPELVAVGIADGLPAYLDWLAHETAQP
jgi:periplasmic divalent cation tolerance protein